MADFCIWIRSMRLTHEDSWNAPVCIAQICVDKPRSEGDEPKIEAETIRVKIQKSGKTKTEQKKSKRKNEQEGARKSKKNERVRAKRNKKRLHFAASSSSRSPI
jgi:hypothetical protein